MKKILLVSVLLTLAAVPFAGEMALVYENEDAVLSGRSSMGIVVPEGVLIPAQTALQAQMSPLVGVVGGPLTKGVLVRLDNELDVALIRGVEIVNDPKLQEAHKIRADAYLRFLPAAGSSEKTSQVQFPGALTEEPFLVKINGLVVGRDELTLLVKRKKSTFRLEVVRTSTTSVWRVSVKIRSDPKLGFWKTGRKKGLNDVPRPLFKYFYQAMFKPLKPGKSFSIPIEVKGIKKDSYTWSLELESKKGSMKKTLPIKFKS